MGAQFIGTKKQIAFLLGSGISIPANIPSVQDITRQLFSGDNIVMNGQRFEFGEVPPNDVSRQKEHRDRIIFLLEEIKKEIQNYYWYNAARSINYEEITYLLIQVHDSLSGEYQNALSQALIKQLLPSLKEHLFVELRTPKREEAMSKVDANDTGAIESLMKEYFKETLNYVIDTVCIMLDRNYETTDHLEFLSELNNDNKYSHIDIFCLNHDLLLESYFKEKGIEYVNGFKPEGDDMVFDPELFNIDHRISLIKLHGSLNWRYDHHLSKYKLYKEYGDLVNPDPLILVGTYNKQQEYVNGFFTALFVEFYQRLQKSNTLVICGYGFSDKAINSQIIFWMNKSTDNKLILIHEDPELLVKSATISIRNGVAKWVDRGQIWYIRKMLSVDSPFPLAELDDLIYHEGS